MSRGFQAARGLISQGRYPPGAGAEHGGEANVLIFYRRINQNHPSDIAPPTVRE